MSAPDHWQPIETAPKDGREVLVAVGKSYTGGVLVAFWCEHDEAWNDWDRDIWEPTHWMPLPGPPTP